MTVTACFKHFSLSVHFAPQSSEHDSSEVQIIMVIWLSGSAHLLPYVDIAYAPAMQTNLSPAKNEICMNARA